MRGVQQPSDGSKFLKRTKNALAGLAENVHLLFLSSVELYVTQIKGYCSLIVSKAEVGSANLNEQPQRSSSTLGNWGGIPEGLLLKKAGAGLLLGHLRNMQAHGLPLDPWVKPTATLHSFFFSTQTVLIVRTALSSCVRWTHGVPPCCMHLAWEKG